MNTYLVTRYRPDGDVSPVTHAVITSAHDAMTAIANISGWSSFSATKKYFPDDSIASDNALTQNHDGTLSYSAQRINPKEAV